MTARQSERDATETMSESWQRDKKSKKISEREKPERASVG